jgi:tol-pal system protein YbgF
MKNKLFWIAISLLTFIQPAFAQEPKATVVGRMTNSSSLELLRRLDQIQEELSQLRGDMEVVNHELSGIKRRQRELYLDMDRRLGDLELASVNSSTAVNSNSLPAQTDSQASLADKDNKTQVASVVSNPEPPTRQEKDAYRSAFNLLKEGRYDRSIKAFAGFMTSYPGSSYADNAQYWLGEANYVSRKYSAAVKEFGKVIATYPESTKVPDAMLKLGFTH